MSKREEAFARMCRVDGQKPTARDRWRAFHRLYRLADNHGGYQDCALKEAMMVLFPWRWMQVLDASESDGLVDRGKLPMFLRKTLLDHARRRRLRKYGGTPERDRAVANKVRNEHGMEVTPEEVAEVRYKLMTLARDVADKLGVRPPEHIDELTAILRGPK